MSDAQLVWVRVSDEYGPPAWRKNWPEKYHANKDCQHIRSAETRTKEDAPNREALKTVSVSRQRAEDDGWTPCQTCCWQ
jgi:hypothetical protein